MGIPFLSSTGTICGGFHCDLFSLERISCECPQLTVCINDHGAIYKESLTMSHDCSGCFFNHRISHCSKTGRAGTGKGRAWVDDLKRFVAWFNRVYTDEDDSAYWLHSVVDPPHRSSWQTPGAHIRRIQRQVQKVLPHNDTVDAPGVALEWSSGKHSDRPQPVSRGVKSPA